MSGADKDGYAKLADFGFATKVEEANPRYPHDKRDRAMSFVGTDHAIPPEVINNTGQNKSGDWWTLGILLYELLSGGPPFVVGSQEANTITLNSMIRRGLADDHVWPPRISKGAIHLIRGLLHTIEKQRLGNQTAEQVKGHEFYHGIDFSLLVARQLPVPWLPELEDENDISYFDEPDVASDYDKDTASVIVNPDDFAEWQAWSL
jgi:serine/threonine protein kinase